MLKTPMHFDLLHQWCPDHNMVALKPFTSKEGDFQGMSGQDFTCASKLLVEAHSVTFVQHPVARSLLVSFQNAQKLLGDRPQASAILEACFRECASLKLPLPPVFESSLLEELSQFDDKDCSKRSSRVLLCRRFFKTEFYNIANTLDRKPWRPCYALLVSRWCLKAKVQSAPCCGSSTNNS